MLLTMSPVGVIENERASSVAGWVVIVSLKMLRASTFLAIVGKMEIRRDNVGKTQSRLGGNDLEKWTRIGQEEYVYMERGLERSPDLRDTGI